jgi:hypothetical protein
MFRLALLAVCLLATTQRVLATSFLKANQCWYFATPVLSRDGQSIETQFSMSNRLQSILNACNASSIQMTVLSVPVDALGKDVWSESFNRFQGTGGQPDRNYMGAGMESIGKTWGYFVVYSAPDCFVPQNQTNPFLPTEWTSIPFGIIPGISSRDGSAAFVTAAPTNPILLFALFLFVSVVSGALVVLKSHID